MTIARPARRLPYVGCLSVVIPFYSNFLLLQNHVGFVVPPAPHLLVYSFIFHVRSMPLRHGSLF